MRTLSLALSVAVLLTIVPVAALATCYHGCAKVNLDIGDYVVLRAGSNAPCDSTCSGSGYDYDLWIRNDCVDQPIGNVYEFCAEEYMPEGVYYVESIGAGCPNTPNGCIRICDCSP